MQGHWIELIWGLRNTPETLVPSVTPSYEHKGDRGTYRHDSLGVASLRVAYLTSSRKHSGYTQHTPYHPINCLNTMYTMRALARAASLRSTRMVLRQSEARAFRTTSNLNRPQLQPQASTPTLKANLGRSLAVALLALGIGYGVASFQASPGAEKNLPILSEARLPSVKYATLSEMNQVRYSKTIHEVFPEIEG